MINQINEIIKPSLLLLSGIVIIGIAASANAQQFYDTWINGIYFDSEGQPNANFITDTIDSATYKFATPNYWPTGFCNQSANIYWLADCAGDSSKLYKIWKTGSVLTTYDAPLNGFAGLEYDGQYLWAVYERTYKLYKIDVTTGATDTIISLPQPDSSEVDRHAWGIAWDGEYFWHSQYGDSAIIYKIDPDNWAVVDSIVPDVNLILAITYADPYLCCLNIQNQRIYRYNTETLELVDGYSWPVNYPLGFFFDSDSTECFYSVSSNSEYGGDEAVYLVWHTVTGINDDGSALPENSALLTAYPNPFNASTKICYSLARQENVTLDIYNMLGQRVERLVEQNQPAGDYALIWNPRELPSGMYFARIYGADFQNSVKLVLLK